MVQISIDLKQMYIKQTVWDVPVEEMVKGRGVEKNSIGEKNWLAHMCC